MPDGMRNAGKGGNVRMQDVLMVRSYRHLLFLFLRSVLRF
jgi:hypothetical protein